MATMRFRATPVTPAAAVPRRRLGAARPEAAMAPPTVSPFNESSWHLREGLVMREGDPEDFSTSPGKLWNLPTRPKR